MAGDLGALAGVAWHLKTGCSPPVFPPYIHGGESSGGGVGARSHRGDLKGLKTWLAVAGTAFLIAGCGGSDPSAETTDKTAPATTAAATIPADGPSKEAYIEAADELCRQMTVEQYEDNIRLLELREATTGRDVLSGDKNAQDLLRLQARIRRGEAQLTDDLRALEAPAADNAEAYLGLREQLEQLYLDGRPDAIRFYRNPNRETMKPIQELSAQVLVLWQLLHEAADNYGFVDCARLHPDPGSVL